MLLLLLLFWWYRFAQLFIVDLRQCNFWAPWQISYIVVRHNVSPQCYMGIAHMSICAIYTEYWQTIFVNNLFIEKYQVYFIIYRKFRKLLNNLNCIRSHTYFMCKRMASQIFSSKMEGKTIEIEDKHNKQLSNRLKTALNPVVLRVLIFIMTNKYSTNIEFAKNCIWYHILRCNYSNYSWKVFFLYFIK